MNQKVKQETQDDAEIAAMAAKVLEQAKNKTNPIQQIQRPQIQGASILNFMQNDKRGKNGSAAPQGQQDPGVSNNGEPPQKNIDEESVRGRFGWAAIDKVHIPYILRNNEKYVSVKMVELKLVKKYVNYLHQDVYNCTCVRSYYITDAEARLLNEINFRHCDYQFGRDQFTTRDLILRLSDAQEFYHFVSSVYSKLANGETSVLDRCGFIRINKESVVPYAMYNGQKVVPLFYFEGETDNLKLKADKLEGWDLSYLKFCCKVQGIRNELFAHDSCSVISLNDIKNYFPPDTLFEDYWPKKNLDSQLLINENARTNARQVQWTRCPTTPQPKLTPSPKPAKTSGTNQAYNMQAYPAAYATTGAQMPYYPAQPRAASPAVRATPYQAAQAANGQMMPSLYYPTVPQAPPPLVRAARPHNSYPNMQQTMSNYMVPDPSMQGTYQQASQMGNYTPSTMDVRHMNGGISRYAAPTQAQYGGGVEASNPATRDLNAYSVQTSQAQQQQQQLLTQQQQATAAHQQQTRRTPTISEETVDNGYGTAGALASAAGSKLVPIPDTPVTGSSHIPYKIQQALVEGIMIPCINMRPYVYTELLVTVNDFISYFFNTVPVQYCEQVMQVLGLDLYKPNGAQMKVLLENHKCQSLNETVPLVLVRNVIEFMPQLKFMLGARDAGANQQRNS